MSEVRLSDEDLLEEVRATYATVKGLGRDLSVDDRLMDDLDIDSLDAIDMLTTLEGRLGVPLLEEVAAQLDGVVTVGDFIRILRGAL